MFKSIEKTKNAKDLAIFFGVFIWSDLTVRTPHFMHSVSLRVKAIPVTKQNILVAYLF